MSYDFFASYGRALEAAFNHVPATFRRFGDTWTLLESRGPWALYERIGKCGHHLTLGKWIGATRPNAPPGERRFTGFSDAAHGKTAWTYGPCHREDRRATFLDRALKRLEEESQKAPRKKPLRGISAFLAEIEQRGANRVSEQKTP